MSFQFFKTFNRIYPALGPMTQVRADSKIRVIFNGS